MKLTTTPLVLVSIALWPMTVVAQETKPAFSFRDNLLLTILASVFGCVFGAAGSFVASYLKIKGLQKAFDLKIQEIQTQMNLQQSHEKKNQEINLRIRYINPLRFATNQLISRLTQIRTKMSAENELAEMKSWFLHIKEFCEQPANRDERGFNVWCHYEGIFAMTTLHYTSIYFAHAIAISKSDPFREIDHGFSVELLDQLNQVKASFAQDAANGIWPESQDNAGLSVSKGELTMNYDEFCKHLVDTSSGPNYGPFLRLIDFYREFLYANSASISEIMSSLVSLKQFLDATAAIKSSSAARA